MNSISPDTIDYLFFSTASSQAQYDNLANTALSRGIDLYLKKDYDGAIRAFKSSAGLAPFSDNAAKAYDYTGKSYLKQNKIEEAIKTYQEAVKIYPTRDSFHLSLGDIYFKAGKAAEAEAEYANAVQLNPTSLDNRYALGQLYLGAGRLTEAKEQFRQAVILAPGSALGYAGLGEAARQKGDANEAIVQLTKAITLDKRFDNAYLELGYAYVDKGDLEKARRQSEVLSFRQSPAYAKLRAYMNNPSAATGFYI